MNIAMILQGMMVGFSIAAPVGAIGLLCIQNTIAHGMVYGLACGLGAATADMMYGILVAVGMQKFAQALIAIQLPMSVLGGLFLCYLGLQKIWEKPTMQTASISSLALLAAYSSTFFLTLTNPATILDFMALFVGLQINVANYEQAFSFVGGVFAGSAAWWLFLSTVVEIFRSHLVFNQIKPVPAAVLRAINCIAGAMIFGFGLWAICNAATVVFHSR